MVLFNQGDEAFYFYIIHSGSIEVIIDNKPKGKLGPGESFGELALVHNSKRTATI